METQVYKRQKLRLRRAETTAVPFKKNGGGGLYTGRARAQPPPPPRWGRAPGPNGPSGPLCWGLGPRGRGPRLLFLLFFLPGGLLHKQEPRATRRTRLPGAPLPHRAAHSVEAKAVVRIEVAVRPCPSILHVRGFIHSKSKRRINASPPRGREGGEYIALAFL